MTTGLVAAYPPVPMAPLGTLPCAAPRLDTGMPWLNLHDAAYCVGWGERARRASKLSSFPAIGLSVRVLGRLRALSGADDLVLPVGARSRGCLCGTRPCLRWLDLLLLVHLELDRAEWLLSKSGIIRVGALRRWQEFE